MGTSDELSDAIDNLTTTTAWLATSVKAVAQCGAQPDLRTKWIVCAGLAIELLAEELGRLRERVAALERKP